MEVLSNLEPKKVWQYFEQITKVPRPSKKEEKMVEFLMKFAKDNNLEARRDKVGNVVIRKPATKGMENRKTVVLQSHMDMVCEKNRDVKIDFDNEGVTPYIDGEWVKAKVQPLVPTTALAVQPRWQSLPTTALNTDQSSACLQSTRKPVLQAHLHLKLDFSMAKFFSTLTLRTKAKCA